MDEQSKQIVKDIQDQRERLGQDREELQTRLRDSTDWRTYFVRYPWIGIGAAAAGGLLVASLIIPRKR